MTPEDCQKNHVEIRQFVERRVDTCRKEVSTELGKMNETLTAFSKAFPHNDDGQPDFGGHREYHDSFIRAAKAQERFWNELRLDIAKKGAWGILIILVGLVFVGLQVKFGLYKVG